MNNKNLKYNKLLQNTCFWCTTTFNGQELIEQVCLACIVEDSAIKDPEFLSEMNRINTATKDD